MRLPLRCKAEMLIRSGKLSGLEAPKSANPKELDNLLVIVFISLKEAPRGFFPGCKMVAQHIVLRLARQTARRQLLRPALAQVQTTPSPTDPEH